LVIQIPVFSMRAIGLFAVLFVVLSAAGQSAARTKCGTDLASEEQSVLAAETAGLDAQELALRRDQLKKARFDQLVCSDSELTSFNRDMAGAYWDAMKRAGRYNTAALRYDQREFEQACWQAVDRLLSENAAGNGENTEGRKAAVADLKERLSDRVKVLNAFEPERTKFEGEWRSASGSVEITKEGADYKVSVAIGAADGVQRGCRAKGKARVEDGGVIADTLDANSKQRRVRLRLKGGGLTGEIVEAGEGDVCIQGEDTERAVYFIPVRPGATDAEEKQDHRRARSGTRRARRDQSIGGMLNSILPTGR
jgi:hypothetical protein